MNTTADEHWPFAFEPATSCSDASRARSCTWRGKPGHGSTAVGLAGTPTSQRTRSRLHIELSERWENEPRLPTRRVPQQGIDGDVAHLSFDNCFEGWRGAARIRDEKLSLRLSSSLPYLVVFTPESKPYYCVEPVSHVSNAIHMSDPVAHGLRALEPGATLDAWMKLEVAPA